MQNVIKNILFSTDRACLYLLNSFAGRFGSLDELFVMLAEGVIFALAGAYLMYLYKSSKSSNRILLLSEAFISTLIARFVFVTGIRLLYFRFRPFVSENVVQLVAHSPLEASFPSGHAAVMAALAVSMWYMNRRLGVLFAIFAVVSGFARVVVGIHYPLDIFVGLLCGVVAAVIARKLYRVVVEEVRELSTKTTKKSKK